MPSLWFFEYKIKLFFTVAAALVTSCSIVVSGQGIAVESSTKHYKEKVLTDSLAAMTDLSTLHRGIRFDLRYATAQNFTGHKLYPSLHTTYLRLEPSRALATIADSLYSKGYGLLIFDAYRPYHVTQKMWELIHDERYVADPAKGSNHNRGLAVDISLYDLATGKAIDMGTGFDNFTDSAHHSFNDLKKGVLASRTLLKESMEKGGFTSLTTEWWHYAWPNQHHYDVLDLSFEDLRKFIRKKRAK